jgi:hypothetical protein
MYKKLLALSLVSASLLCGCGNYNTIDDMMSEAENSSSTADSKSPLELETPTAITEPTTDTAPVEDVTVSSDDDTVDLTQLSPSMVYAQVYDMTYNPDRYTGKTIIAKGQFTYYQDPNTQNEYFAVLISDAAACCSQGIEFVLDGDYTYPDDYPALDETITVTGTYNSYKEEYNTYVQLLNAKIIS